MKQLLHTSPEQLRYGDQSFFIMDILYDLLLIFMEVDLICKFVIFSGNKLFVLFIDLNNYAYDVDYVKIHLSGCFVQAYKSVPGLHVHGVGEELNLVLEVGLFKGAKSI